MKQISDLIPDPETGEIKTRIRRKICIQVPFNLSYKQAVYYFKRLYIIEVLRCAEGNVQRACRMLRHDHSDFYKLARKLGIDLIRIRKEIEEERRKNG